MTTSGLRNFGGFIDRLHSPGGGWALACLLAGLTLTAFYARHEKNDADAEALREFDSVCRDVRVKIQDSQIGYEQLLHSGAAFFAGSERVTRGSWRAFCERQNTPRNFPGIQGFGYAVVVPRANRVQQVEAVRAEGFPDYQIWPEGDRENYSAVVFLEPFAGRNLRAFGYDMFSEPVRRSAMERARDHAEAALSGKVILVQETDQGIQFGLLLYVPVYRRGAPVITVAERRAALLGWVYSPYRVNDLMEGILGRWNQQERERIRLEIFDGETAALGALLYDFQPGDGKTGAAAGQRSQQEVIEWAGRHWLLRFTVNRGAAGAVDYSMLRMVIGGGVIGSLLLSGLVLSLINTRRTARRMAERLTRDLRQNEERWKFALEGSRNGAWDWNVETNTVIYSPRWKEMLGYAENEIGTGLEEWSQRVHPADFPQTMADLQTHLDGKTETYSNEHRVHCRDGSWKWVLDRGLVVSRTASGQPRRMVGTHSDIAARKAAELALHASEEKLRALFNTMSEGVALNEIVHDANGEMCDYRILEVNQAFYAVADYEPGEVVGNVATKLYGMSPASIRLFGKSHRERTEAHRTEFVSPRTGRCYAITSSPFVQGRFVTTFFDLTQRQQAETALAETQSLISAIVESTDDMIWTANSQDFGLLTFNRSFEQYLSQERGVAIKVGDRPKDLFERADDVERWEVFFQRARSEPFSTEYLNLTGKRVFNLSFNPIKRDGVVFAISVFAKDCTARNQAATALLASRENYRLLFEGMLDGFAVHEIICDAAGRPVDYRFLSVNPAFERLTGLRGAEVIGRTVLEVMPETEPKWIERYAQVAATGEGVEFEEYSEVLKRHFEIAAYRNKPGQFATVFIDITERKRVESELRKLSRTVEQAPVSIVITDLAGAIEYVNPWFTQVSGFTFAEVRGKNPRVLKSNLTPPVVYQDLWRTLMAGRVWRGELHNRKKNGESYVELAVIAPILGPDGRATHFGAIKEDVTAQKRAEAALRESEELFRGVFGSSPIPILLTTAPEGRLIEVNSSCLATFGYDRDEVIGKTTEELGLWAVPAQRLELFRRIAEGESFQGVEVTMRTKSGVERIMLCTGRRLTIAGRACVLASAVEITALRRAEAEKAQMQEGVFQSQKFEALGTLAGGIAHDFNNILTGVINYTALAEMDCPDSHPQIKEFLGEVLHCGNRAKDLVRQILLFSRSEEAERGPVSLQHVVGEALSLLRSTIPAAVKIESQIDRNAPLVLANATQIHQVIVNVGINAAHAMQERGGILTVKLEQRMVGAALVAEHPTLKPGPHVGLEISDTGCGMEPAIVARIFDPFFTTKKRGEGTGLGLAVVHSVVRSHEGAIAVRSQPGVGTTFEILLPVLPLNAATGDSADGALPRGRGQRILLVDDEPMVARSGQIMLERLGYVVTMFTSPEDALARFWASPNDFEALITDYQMPGMTGFVLAKKFLAQRPAMPVFVASGFASGMTWEAMRAEGITGFFHKPASSKELAEVLAQTFRADVTVN